METRVNAFVCDLTADDLSKQISTSSVDIVTMIFVLSAVSPEKMPLVQMVMCCFRDYAIGDLAQAVGHHSNSNGHTCLSRLVRVSSLVQFIPPSETGHLKIPVPSLWSSPPDRGYVILSTDVIVQMQDASKMLTCSIAALGKLLPAVEK
ncbi:S-adenosyl-L-methionine-dependent methyltransferases superfamily protein [Actinidia rufa]|uniref:S-adenosyl-L-methionine-dependent methyltransferases superfamily protein n=1 Tax=Actinidia rufa TaxID=165716 RepID=A0A7J0GXN4_9ERIC|nr:S-adenosyl-L-methionine-dependent methyltransferases superfamily protein [Actinidia rufa]